MLRKLLLMRRAQKFAFSRGRSAGGPWLWAAGAIWLLRAGGNASAKKEALVYSEKLRPGQHLLVSNRPPRAKPTRKQRKATKRDGIRDSNGHAAPSASKARSGATPESLP